MVISYVVSITHKYLLYLRNTKLQISKAILNYFCIVVPVIRILALGDTWTLLNAK